MSDFYLTLPSHSSLNEFPNNRSNSFKVRLARPMRLEGNWKVALASISVPDPKNVLPSWLTEHILLVYNSWYNATGSNLSSRHYLDASFLLRDVNDHIDLNMMSGFDFMNTVVGWFRKKRIENDLRANRALGFTSVDSQRNQSTDHPFYVKYRVEDNDVIIDASNVKFHDFGRHHLNTPTEEPLCVYS